MPSFSPRAIKSSMNQNKSLRISQIDGHTSGISIVDRSPVSGNLTII
jgi:hypothetical protein